MTRSTRSLPPLSRFSSRRRGLILAAGLFAVLAYRAFIPTDRITLYSATCLTRAADGSCAVLGRTLEPTTFHVSQSRQIVEVIADSAPRRLRDCAVTSRDDWHCRSVDGSFTLGMRGGRPWQQLPQGRTNDLVSLSYWRYLWLRTGEEPPKQGPAVFR